MSSYWCERTQAGRPALSPVVRTSGGREGARVVVSESEMKIIIYK